MLPLPVAGNYVMPYGIQAPVALQMLLAQTAILLYLFTELTPQKVLSLPL